MKRTIFKIITCVFVFMMVLYISSAVINQGNTDMTAEISEATFPTVTMQIDGMNLNTLYGYDQEIDAGLERDSITPLTKERKLSFVMDKHKNKIDAISFEVRSVDGERLVENTTITDYKETSNQIRANITVKDLIEANQEYNFILLVNNGHKTLRFYTRIIQAEDYFSAEKLKFVKDFHDRTFDKEKAGTLISYLESNSKGDNTSYSKVDIHSSFSQITWGDLNPVEEVPACYTIKEISSQTASIQTNCVVSVKEGRTVHAYNVEEYFRVRYTTERMYLLEYERTMHQIFNPEEDVFGSNKIMVGIADMDSIQLEESDGGSIVAFVNEDQLFCYNEADNKLSYLFSFYDEYDTRSLNNHHGIKILNVDETGNIKFMVYGYMNRGRYEGRIGIQVYSYNGMTNTIEEQAFIPYDKSYSCLKYNMEQLSFVNHNNTLFLYLDGSIVAVDLLEDSYNIVASNLQEGNFEVADSNEMLVWQTTTDPYDCAKLVLMNLNTMKQNEITASGNDRLLPLGFMGEDLLYGIARNTDIVKDSTGAVTFPMYEVRIQNEQGKVLKQYRQNGTYIVGSTIEKNLITLKRVIIDEETGEYTATTDDQIMNNQIEESGLNTMEVVPTQNYENIVQIVLKSEIEEKSLRILTPKEVLFEGERLVRIVIEDTMNRYYVYYKGNIAGAYTDSAKAVNLAYTTAGSVIDKNGTYVWTKGRVTKNQIMAIEGTKTDERNGSVAVCLNTILSFEGTTRNTQQMLDNGQSVTQILTSALPNETVLDLGGCPLDAVLSFVNKDIPVMAILDDGNAVLIVGFNELNIVVMDPLTGTVAKKGMNDSTTWLQENGNRFITYYSRQQ